MRRIIIILGLAALMLSIGSAVFAQTMVTLEQAISDSVNEIENRLERGAKVMVLNFNSPSLRLTNYVLDEITTMLSGNGKLSVVEKVNLEFILRELRYQRSGDISDDTAQSIGRILGAQYIISGTIEESGSNYVIQFKTMSVEPEALQTLTRVGVIKDAQINDLLGYSTVTSPGGNTSYPRGVEPDYPGADAYDLNRTLVLSAGTGAFGGMQILVNFKGNSTDSEPTFVFGAPLFVNADLFTYLSLNLSLYYINTDTAASHSGAGSFSVFGKIPIQLNDRFTLFPLLGAGYNMSILSKLKGSKLAWRKDVSGDFLSTKLGVGMNYYFTGNLMLNASFIGDLLLYNKNISIKDAIFLTPSLFIGVSYVFLEI